MLDADRILREQIKALLQGGNAHMSFDDAVAGFPLEYINRNPPNVPFPHGSGQNVLREFFVVADHNSYHIGEFAILRQVMGTWRNHQH